MDDINGMLEFDKIRELLKEGASTERARERIDALVPILDQERAEAAIEETTEARKVLDVNKQERHIRGGLATREKYLQKEY